MPRWHSMEQQDDGVSVSIAGVTLASIIEEVSLPSQAYVDVEGLLFGEIVTDKRSFFSDDDSVKHSVRVQAGELFVALDGL